MTDYPTTFFSKYDGGTVSEEDVQNVKDHFANLLQEIPAGFEELNQAIEEMSAGGSDHKAAREAVTENNGKMAETAYQLALELFQYLTAE